MLPKSLHLQIHQLLFAILVLLAIPQTFGALSCEKLYSKLSVYAETNAEITILSANTKSLIFNLVQRPDMLDSKQLKTRVQELMRQSEKYFEAAQISFEPVKERIIVQGLSDKDTYVLTYNKYKMSGAMVGDEIARMIFGVQSHPDFKNFPVEFIYDPLFQKQHPDSRATFGAGKRWEISFGSDVFLFRNGENNSLRHEIQHYFEAVRVKEGKMTLARIKLMNSSKKRGMSYSKLLSMDELEAYIRDIRDMLNMPLIQKKDERMAAFKSATQMAYIRNFRRERLQQKIETLSELLSNSVRMSKIMKEVLPKIEDDLSLGSGADGQTSYEFDFPHTFPYETIQVDVHGLLNLKTANSSQVKESMAKVFAWNLKRADEIQTELNQLKSKAKELGLLQEKSE